MSILDDVSNLETEIDSLITRARELKAEYELKAEKDIKAMWQWRGRFMKASFLRRRLVKMKEVL
jgi:hypothetical protein